MSPKNRLTEGYYVRLPRLTSAQLLLVSGYVGCVQPLTHLHQCPEILVVLFRVSLVCEPEVQKEVRQTETEQN